MNNRILAYCLGSALALTGCSDDGTAAGDTEGSGGTDGTGTTGTASGTSAASTSSGSGTSTTGSDSDSTTAASTGTGSDTDGSGGSSGGGSSGSTGGTGTDTDTDGTGTTGGDPIFPCIDNETMKECTMDTGCEWLPANGGGCVPENIGDACAEITDQTACEAIDLCAWDGEACVDAEEV